MDITKELILVLIVFWIIVFWTFYKKKQRLLKRDFSDWFIDIAGLLQQGFLFPIIQSFLLFTLFNNYIPQYKGIFQLPFILSFILQFIVIDYLYYWNHRLLHVKNFWFLHRVHHSAKKLDVFVTSRNSFISSFFICYLWIHSIFIFLLNDANGFILAIALGNALDLWRHSGIRLEKNIESLMRLFLILPHDHEWHHSSTIYDTNFGANFNLWDKLHGTYHFSMQQCEVLGENLPNSISLKWLFPWKLKQEKFK